MCVVSNVGDYGKQMWPKPWDLPPSVQPYTGPTKEQFEEFLELLRAARKFDKVAGQADCPAEEKTGWIEELAKRLGVPVEKVREALA